VAWSTVQPGSPAHARTTWTDKVPNNAVHACSTCHLEEPDLNWFGADVYLSYRDTREFEWPALFAGDSDRDGWTNGEELGDPCGTWAPGGSPPLDVVSNPGDAESVLPAEPALICADTGNADTGPVTGGGDSCLYSVTGPGTGSLALLLAALALALRRTDSPGHHR